MILNNESLKNRADWESMGYRLPAFDRDAMVEKTKANPTWLHFGAGNIFKAFQADACQRLLDAGEAETGIIAAERREKKPEANDNLTVKVTLRADGNVEKAVVGSIAEKVYLYGNEARLKEIFENPSLQMVSFTITEKATAWLTAKANSCRTSLPISQPVRKPPPAIWAS
jgi:fructuronate reductase